MSEPLTMSAEREAEIFRYSNLFHTDPAVTDLRVELDATRNELEIVTRDRDSWKLQSQTHNIDLISERAAHKRTQEALTKACAEVVNAMSFLEDYERQTEQLRHSREVWTELLQECRDKRAWLKFKLETAICHVPGEYKMGQRVSDGWCAVRLPDWDVKQKIESLDAAIALAERDSNAAKESAGQHTRGEPNAPSM